MNQARFIRFRMGRRGASDFMSLALAVCAFSHNFSAPAATAGDVKGPRGFVTSSTLKLDFAFVPKGRFSMGARRTPEELQTRKGNPWFDRELPVHEVELDQFYMGVTEITRAHWRMFNRETRFKTVAEHARSSTKWFRAGFEQEDCHPVTHISYTDAVAFAKWLSERDGEIYRLPTEAEWEYACRAGGNERYVWSGDFEQAYTHANLHSDKDGFENTACVGSFEPNAWGIRDMIGNVWEWCSDWVGDTYYATSAKNNPTGPQSGKKRAIRGASFHDTPKTARIGHRNLKNPRFFYDNTGFRLVREAPPTRQEIAAEKKLREAVYAAAIKLRHVAWETILGQALTTVADRGQSVRLDDVRWRILAARNLGSVLRRRFLKQRKTAGRFVFVKIEVENLGAEPKTFLSRDLYDNTGRRFGIMTDAVLYFDENLVLGLETINPNVPVRFVQVYEVPKNASELAVSVSNLRLLQRQEALLLLGL